MYDTFVTDNHASIKVNGLRTVQKRTVLAFWYRHALVISYDKGKLENVRYHSKADRDAMYDALCPVRRIEPNTAAQVKDGTN